MRNGRTIGALYDHEKFKGEIENALSAYLQSVMSGFAQSEAEENIRRQIMINNLYSMIGNLSIEYYQMLEKYIDGEPVAGFADYSPNQTEPDYAQNKTDKGLVELIMACRQGLWKVKEPEKAEAYYNAKFPERAAENTKNVLSDIFPTLSPEEAIAQAKAMHKAELVKGKQGEKELKAMRKANEKAYKAYMKGLRKQDREAYDKLKALHKLEQAEQKKLMKLHNKVVKHNAKFGYLNELAQLDPDKRAFSEKDKEKFAKLRREEKLLLNARDEYKESLQVLNEQRLASGAITNEHYDMRESQLTTFDFTYRAMRDYREMRNAQQASMGNEMRVDDEEMLRAEREAALQQEPVRERINLRTEEKTVEIKEQETVRDEEIVAADDLERV